MATHFFPWATEPISWAQLQQLISHKVQDTVVWRNSVFVAGGHRLPILLSAVEKYPKMRNRSSVT